MSSELFAVCFWSDCEGKRRAAGLFVISARRTRLQLGVRASAVTVEAQLQSGRFTRELHCLMFNLYF